MPHSLPDPGWRFDHSYARLPQALFQYQAPEAVHQPGLVLLNAPLAVELGLDFDPAHTAAWAALFAGNQAPEGALPIAQAYAGHQFGHFTMLGDGRAVLLGEHLNPKGERVDIQFKGSGRTPYSRRGDGRATLGAMLREYLISEAMHYLGIPTTRSLAVARTGEKVMRETVQEGAVLTRIAQSHIRVGTFEYAVRALEPAALEAFVRYVLERHYPEHSDTAQPALALLEAVMDRQADLIVHWMRVGFVHGVMNTDNMSIAGETIDYGPCAFMNAYNQRTVFSSIDTGGRYAFGHQPFIAQWNLAVLAGTLLPLIDADEQKALQTAQALINQFPIRYTARWYAMMYQKLGLLQPEATDKALVDELLGWMQTQGADYTDTFVRLMNDMDMSDQDDSFRAWHGRWRERIAAQPGGLEAAHARMRQVNPVFIPRNHLVEQALEDAKVGDWRGFEALLEAVKQPYTPLALHSQMAAVPADFDRLYQTFCGT